MDNTHNIYIISYHTDAAVIETAVHRLPSKTEGQLGGGVSSPFRNATHAKTNAKTIKSIDILHTRSEQTTPTTPVRKNNVQS